MFLTPEELVELTDCQRSHEQKQWLDARGWVYEVSRLGTVKVLRGYAEMKLGMPAVPSETVDLSEFDGDAPLAWLLKYWDEFRFEPHEVIAQAFQYPVLGERVPQVGIYFLLVSSRIMYVGQSVQIPFRLAAHAKTLPFTHVFTFAASCLLLDEIEAAYIHRLMPEWNTKIPPRTMDLPWCS